MSGLEQKMTLSTKVSGSISRLNLGPDAVYGDGESGKALFEDVVELVAKRTLYDGHAIGLLVNGMVSALGGFAIMAAEKMYPEAVPYITMPAVFFGALALGNAGRAVSTYRKYNRALDNIAGHGWAGREDLLLMSRDLAGRAYSKSK
jgi:hypothetical protein